MTSSTPVKPGDIMFSACFILNMLFMAIYNQVTFLKVSITASNL